MLYMAQNIFQLEESPKHSENLVMNFEESSGRNNMRKEMATSSRRDSSISKSYEFSDKDEQESKNEDSHESSHHSNNSEKHNCCEEEHVVFKEREKFYL